MQRNKEFDQQRSGMEVMGRSYLDRPEKDQGLRSGSKADSRGGYGHGGQPFFSDSSINHEQTRSRGYSKNTQKTGASRPLDDLVLEDSIEDSETLLGDGKSGLFGKTYIESATTSSRVTSNRPRSSQRKGMSGPITSSRDDVERRHLQRYNRPNTGRRVPAENSAGVSELQNDSASRLGGSRSKISTSKTVTDILAPSKSRQESLEASMKLLSQQDDKNEIDSILSMGRKTTKGPSAARNSRHAVGPSKPDLDDLDSYQYGFSKSSISNDKPPSRPSSSSSSGSRPNSAVKSDALSQSSASRTSASKKTEHHSPIKMESKSSLNVMDFEDMMDDLDELGALDIGPSFVQKQLAGSQVDSKPIDLKTAVALKTLVFGDAKQCFNEEWKYQSFTFCDARRLKYGFVQKKGGPCGVLASVQALLMQQLLFAEGKSSTVKSLAPSDSTRTEALAVTIATILWRAGQDQLAVVTLPSFRPQFMGGAKYRSDNLTETLFINTFTRYDDLLTFVRQNVTQFEFDGTSGVVLFLYSAILSRSVEGVRSDMDETGSKLMGAHGYCTQDMVNLILTGRAAPNVFNDIVELDSGQGEVTVLKGIHRRNDIGFLSLFEHYKSCEVGTYLKTPKFPIWVVCSESHFSVLFSLKKELLSDWKAERRFDMYYYDGLARQEDEIRLTIDTNNRFFQPPADDDLVPPLELCIRTKWDGAEVDWNGTEPLL